MLVPTLSHPPSSASTLSSALLEQAGYLRPLPGSHGMFMHLPLGVRTLDALCDAVRSSLAPLAADECAMPSVLPGQTWTSAGREIGPEVFSLSDRKDRPLVLAPTAEEVFTSLVAAEIDSYRSLPLRLYQIGNKYRDEVRPRFGLMRSREFVMKDMYTFDHDKDAALATYHSVCSAYAHLFSSLGLDSVRAAADSGDIGGDLSHEFHIKADLGEDALLACSDVRCGFAANVERVPHGTSPGDPCLQCNSGTLHQHRGIELGHAFYLGTKYSAPLNASINVPAGEKGLTKSVPAQMGCFGIGVSRLYAALQEVHGDNHGLRWPLHIAPYKVLLATPPPRILASNPDIAAATNSLTHSLASAFPDSFLLDDRDLSPGNKLKSASLLGIPAAVAITPKPSLSAKLSLRFVTPSGSHADAIHTKVPLPSVSDTLLQLFTSSTTI